MKHSETKWWTRSTDKIWEVISHFASVQSNSVALEGSCQSKVYRSVVLCKKICCRLYFNQFLLSSRQFCSVHLSCWWFLFFW